MVRERYTSWATARGRYVAGVKAATRTVVSGEALKVYVARDAKARIVQGLVDVCRDRGIEVVWADTMEELGELCGLRVGAAACAEIKGMDYEN